MLPSIEPTMTSISDIINNFGNEYLNVKDYLLSEISKLIKFILTIPASAATAECSFSALRRLKTYLRSTMTQKRLTHSMILNVHKSMTEKNDLKLIEFVSKTTKRKSKFLSIKKKYIYTYYKIITFYYFHITPDYTYFMGFIALIYLFLF